MAGRGIPGGFAAKLKIELVVPDEDLAIVLREIIPTARTGETAENAI